MVNKDEYVIFQLFPISKYTSAPLINSTVTSNKNTVSCRDQWCKQDQIPKTKSIGSKQRHLADL